MLNLMKHKKKILILSFLILLLLAAVAYYGIIHVAPYAIIKPFRSNNIILTNYLRSSHQKIIVKTDDDVNIVCYLIKSKLKMTKGTIIILHGIGGNKESQIGTAEHLAASGFNSIIFDLRAQGESGGKYCTYGYYEKNDISKIIDTVIEKFKASGDIGIMGTSLGGAIAIQAMAFDRRIKCGIIISTFASLYEIMYAYMNNILHIPFKFVSDAALTEAGKIANFPPEEINPFVDARRIHQPILIFHGSVDERIDISNGRKIFLNLSSKEKKFFEVKNASHFNVAATGGVVYETSILNFFNLYLYGK